MTPFYKELKNFKRFYSHIFSFQNRKGCREINLTL